MGRLLLMRHGKAANPSGVPDFDRPLADRGRHEAAVAGAWIREHVGQVDLVLCSSAQRTRETFAATNLEAPVHFLDEIYEAWTGDLLAAVNAVDPQADTVLMVGHSPGTPSLAARLAGADSDPGLLNQIRAGFPTSAIAVLDFSTSWADLDTGDAVLSTYVVPR